MSVIDTDPALLANLERRATIDATLASIREEGEARRARHAVERAANEQERQEAVAAGVAPPPLYETPLDTTAETIRALVAEHGLLRKAYEVRLGELLPEIEREAVDAAAAARDDCTPAIALIERAKTTLTCTLGLLRRARTAAATANSNRVVRPHAGERTCRLLTDVHVLAFARGDFDPLEPEPVRRPDRPVVEQVTQDEEPGARLGLQQRGAFGFPPEPRPRSSRDDFL